MISGGTSGAWYYPLMASFLPILQLAADTGFYASMLLLGYGFALLLGTYLFALEGILVTAAMNSETYLANCVKKAIRAGTHVEAMRQISDIPKRIGNAIDKGWGAVFTSVGWQLYKIWSLTCGLPG